MKGKKTHYSLDRPSHGWEGISGISEIYGGSSTRTAAPSNEDDKPLGRIEKEEREKYLRWLEKAREVALQDTPQAAHRAAFMTDLAERLFISRPKTEPQHDTPQPQALDEVEQMRRILDGIAPDIEPDIDRDVKPRSK